MPNSSRMSTTRCSARCRLALLALGLSSPIATAQVSTARVEQNDPAITYTGTWYSNNSSANSDGVAALTNERGARASITFNGTGITWIGALDQYNGVAQVYLDGTLNTVDTYAPNTKYQQPLFVARGLAAGSHTLSVEVLHTRDGNTSGSWVWIDAFDIENGSAIAGGVKVPAGRTEQNDSALQYNGTWFLNTNSAQSAGTAVLAVNPGDRATLTFTGTGIRWIAYRDAWCGIARVYLDGALVATVDTYVATDQPQSTGYEAGGLLYGTHTLTVEVTGTHSPVSGGSWIWVDAFDVF